ncbi:cupin domain-containing protein [Agarilytica rhodophyticola]|uniref:cupin domain-containing protein n=1 Tax=Agarilytica rhodophyticola TaxID=1737490 RepID=UPI000CD975C9|nr:cupin domain-containing protein [Agarilytica rhodophyticola]
MRINILFSLFLSLYISSSHAGEAKNLDTRLDAKGVIALLDLEAHIEGGYFKQTFIADHRSKIKTPNGERFTMTSIYYLLTDESPKGHFHINKSDIVHYFHGGKPIEYFFITPDGKLERHVLGPDISSGHSLQLIVPGGYWKAARLMSEEDSLYDYGLLGDAVAPGFDYKDMKIGERDVLIKKFPQHKELIRELTRH